MHCSDLCLCSFGRIDFRVWYLVDYIFVYLGDFICLDNAGPKEPIADRVGDDFRRIRTFFWGAWVDFVSFFKRPAGGVRLVCSGDPFDIAHGVGNFLVCLALFKPLDYLLDRMERQRQDN